MSTQSEIAERVGVDISTVNKILNRVEGPVFRQETIKQVFSMAKKLKYDFSRASKGELRRTLCDLFPKGSSTAGLVVLRGCSGEEVDRIRRMLYGEPEFTLDDKEGGNPSVA
jgi:DNA-binding LacI/PurR family transcriptional regulator